MALHALILRLSLAGWIIAICHSPALQPPANSFDVLVFFLFYGSWHCKGAVSGIARGDVFVLFLMENSVPCCGKEGSGEVTLRQEFSHLLGRWKRLASFWSFVRKSSQYTCW